jgi:hypothetical protein
MMMADLRPRYGLWRARLSNWEAAARQGSDCPIIRTDSSERWNHIRVGAEEVHASGEELGKITVGSNFTEDM